MSSNGCSKTEVVQTRSFIAGHRSELNSVCSEINHNMLNHSEGLHNRQMVCVGVVSPGKACAPLFCPYNQELSIQLFSINQMEIFFLYDDSLLCHIARHASSCCIISQPIP